MRPGSHGDMAVNYGEFEARNLRKRPKCTSTTRRCPEKKKRNKTELSKVKM